eukprot:3399854-Pleurochrysis_carterae.AAC.1
MGQRQTETPDHVGIVLRGGYKWEPRRYQNLPDLQAALASLPTYQHLGQDLLNRPSHPVPTQALFERAPQNRRNAPQACALVPKAPQVPLVVVR